MKGGETLEQKMICHQGRKRGDHEETERWILGVVESGPCQSCRLFGFRIKK
jgi:hypothetical protein